MNVFIRLFFCCLVILGVSKNARAQVPSLIIFSPQNYQVFQRSSALYGEATISGHLNFAAHAIEIRVTGASCCGALPSTWKPIPFLPNAKTFTTRFKLVAGGWYRLDVRALATDGSVVLSTAIEKFGVGEVFLAAGQSNSTNFAESLMTTQTGMVAQFDGQNWGPGDDPFRGVHDSSSRGSVWAPFGDALYQRLKVPVAVVSVGHGGTTIALWAPEEELFNYMVNHAIRLGPNGLRGVMWDLGETDGFRVHYNPGSGDNGYYDMLKEIIYRTGGALGWSPVWFVAIASVWPTMTPPKDAIRDAQFAVIDEGYAVLGPDTDQFLGEYRSSLDHIHFSPLGQTTVGAIWANRVADYIVGLLGNQASCVVTQTCSTAF